MIRKVDILGERRVLSQRSLSYYFLSEYKGF